MTPAFYIRPNARTGGASGTDGPGVTANVFSPRIHHWPWVENSALRGDCHYWLGAAEFPLNDHALPPAMWDFFRVKEWRITGTFTDASYDSGDDRPNLSRTMSHVFSAGTSSRQGWTTDVSPFSEEYGVPWASPDDAIRSNGYVEDLGLRTCTAAIERTERVLYTDEEDVSSYYYVILEVTIGKPILYRPLTEADVPPGGTLGEWGWVLPFNLGGSGFGSADAIGGVGRVLSYNGVDVMLPGHDPDDSANWSITLTEESYYE